MLFIPLLLVLFAADAAYGYAKKEKGILDKNALHLLLSEKVNQTVDRIWADASKDKEALQSELLHNLYPLLLEKTSESKTTSKRVLPNIDTEWEWKVIRSSFRTLLRSPLLIKT